MRKPLISPKNRVKQAIKLNAAPEKSPPGWLTVRNSAEHDTVEMLINGSIGKSWYDPAGIASKEFRDEFAKIPKGRKVNVRINSDGGSIGDALEIYNVIQERQDDVTCINDGYALSSASIVLCAGGRSVCPTSSICMIHEPWTQTSGDAEDHRRAMEMLETHGDTIAAIYAERTGKTEDEMRALMKAETWLTGEEAVEMGLADDDGEEEEAGELVEPENRFASLNLARYRNIPAHIFNMLRAGGGSKQITAYRTPDESAQTIFDPSQGAKAGSAASNINSTQTALVVNSQIMPKLETPVAAATPPANSNEQLLQAIAIERKARITAEVKNRAANKIANAQLAWWVEQAMTNEEATYAQLENLPVNRPGGEPLGAAPAEANASETVYEVVNSHTMTSKVNPRAGKRLEFMRDIQAKKNRAERLKDYKNDWTGKFNHAAQKDIAAVGGNVNHLPVNANSYSTTLITDFLIDVAITQLQNRWAALEAFTRDFSTDRYKPLATGQIKLVTAGSTTLVATKNSPITSFESGDSTISPISVPMQHYAQPFHVGQDELMSGLRMENLTTINLAALADTIITKALSPLAGSVYSAGTYFATKGTFGWTNEMPDLRGYLKKSPLKNAVLDSPFFSRLVNQPGFFQEVMGEEGPNSSRIRGFGWDNVSENTNWAGAPFGIGGFVCNPQAIGAVAGLPQVPPSIPGAVLQESTITIPGPDISIAQYVWFSLASRTLWTSYDVVFGAAAGDLTAAALLFNGIGPRS